MIRGIPEVTNNTPQPTDSGDSGKAAGIIVQITTGILNFLGQLFGNKNSTNSNTNTNTNSNQGSSTTNDRVVVVQQKDNTIKYIAIAACIGIVAVMIAKK
jgi:hypothetical protein